jgi:hypothetical protein
MSEWNNEKLRLKALWTLHRECLCEYILHINHNKYLERLLPLYCIYPTHTLWWKVQCLFKTKNLLLFNKENCIKPFSLLCYLLRCSLLNIWKEFLINSLFESYEKITFSFYESVLMHRELQIVGNILFAHSLRVHAGHFFQETWHGECGNEKERRKWQETHKKYCEVWTA